MKKNLTFALLSIGLLALASCHQDTVLVHGNLKISFDDQMQSLITTSFQGAEPLMDSFNYSEFIQTTDFIAKDFMLKSKEKTTIHDPAGEGTRWILKGDYADYPLKKIVSVTTYDQYPDAAYYQVSYVNEGDQDLDIESWSNNQYAIKPSSEEPSKFWSFQGSSHEDRRDWLQEVKPGFKEKNFMGMNNSDYGGGIPMVDLWRNDIGIAVGVTDSVLRLVNLPIQFNSEGTQGSLGVEYQPSYKLSLKAGDTLKTYETFVSVQRGDAFASLRNYANYMQTKGIKAALPELAAYEPMWCAWGYEKDFTIKEILATLPKAKELGFKWVGIDDGYFIHEGDWEANSKQFPRGSKDMKALVDSIHAHGLKAMLWWNPLAVSPKSNFMKDHPDAMLKKEDGSHEYITWWDSYYLSPTDPKSIEMMKNTIDLFINQWGFDGLKLDGQNLNLTAPDYGKSNPNQSFEELPTVYKNILEQTRDIVPDGVVEFCPCGDVMNFYIMPYTNQFVSSDPESSWQVRSKGFVYHALMPSTAFYGDHVELINDDFASQIGIGAVPGSKFVWPTARPDLEQSLLLTPEKDSLYKKWMDIYNEKELSRGDYQGDLYNIGFDLPETHVIEKEGVLYYSLYAKNFEGQIDLRGLDPQQEYEVKDYVNDQSYGSVKGDQSNLKVHFENYLLLEAIPQNRKMAGNRP